MGKEESFSKKDWLVYILQCKDGTYYSGATNNLEKRMKAHSNGKGAKYTKIRGIEKLIAFKDNLTKKEALSLEAHLKKQPRKNKLNFLLDFNSF